MKYIKYNVIFLTIRVNSLDGQGKKTFLENYFSSEL